MRKSNVKVSAIMAAMVLMLTGCGGSLPDMTQEEEQMIGEYAATILLKYDVNNRSRLVSREEVEAEAVEEQQPEEEEVTEPTHEGMEPVEETPVVEIGQETSVGTTGSAEEFFDFPAGLMISYQGDEICDSYPQGQEMDSFFSLDASEGNQLLVLKFRIENSSQADQAVDMLSQNANIRVNVNGSYNKKALTTMLMDDMSTYIGSIPAGGYTDVVLLAELDNDMANNVSSLTLNLKKESKTCTIRLK